MKEASKPTLACKPKRVSAREGEREEDPAKEGQCEASLSLTSTSYSFLPHTPLALAASYQLSHTTKHAIYILDKSCFFLSI